MWTCICNPMFTGTSDVSVWSNIGDFRFILIGNGLGQVEDWNIEGWNIEDRNIGFWNIKDWKIEFWNIEDFKIEFTI